LWWRGNNRVLSHASASAILHANPLIHDASIHPYNCTQDTWHIHKEKTIWSAFHAYLPLNVDRRGRYRECNRGNPSLKRD
jgi:hypothetical protein